MNRVVGRIESTGKKSSNNHNAISDGNAAHFKERRKNKHDRRKSVRDGVFVSISFKNDRRVVRDRRKVY
jgi:hypothetical protein